MSPILYIILLASERNIKLNYQFRILFRLFLLNFLVSLHIADI